jgi:hypothetical protein
MIPNRFVVPVNNIPRNVQTTLFIIVFCSVTLCSFVCDY